jgi:hypothetical protein
MVHVPTALLLGLIFGTAALVIVSRLLRGIPLLAGVAPPAAAEPAPAVIAPAEPAGTFAGLAATPPVEG